MRISIRFFMLTFFFALAAVGQTFSSGSTGTDGALDLTLGDKTVPLPDSGVLNYTTVNIPVGRTLHFQNNLANTPVIMLVQGAVRISGLIDVSAPGFYNSAFDLRTPGPGGSTAAMQDHPGSVQAGAVPALQANGPAHCHWSRILEGPAVGASWATPLAAAAGLAAAVVAQ